MRNKIAYFNLLINLKLVFLITNFLRLFAFIITPKTKKHDLILFPFTQKGSDGYTRRFEEYFRFFKEEFIDFYVCDVFDNDYIIKKEKESEREKYKLYRNIAWIRLKQVLKARKYKAAFIHRGLFPYYPDLIYPHFEKLLRKLNDNITIDFWDSVWLYSGKKLIKETVKHCDKITVVNQFLADYFSFSEKQKIIFPIGVNVDRYKLKTNHNLNNPIKLFYTGGPGNVNHFLRLMKAVLSDLKLIFNFELIIVSSCRTKVKGINITYFDFNNNFFEIMKSCDIGLYRIEDNEDGRGKMAMKVLDYMSAGLPSIISPIGISPHIIDNKHALFAGENNEWKEKFKLLLNDKDLRAKLSNESRYLVKTQHNIKESFKHLINIIKNDI